METRRGSFSHVYQLVYLIIYNRLYKPLLAKDRRPRDMLEWIWIHIAINAGVTSTAGRTGEIDKPKSRAMGAITGTMLIIEFILIFSKIYPGRAVKTARPGQILST